MGLTFSVANPQDVFSDPFGDVVAETLRSIFGDEMELDSTAAPFCSVELGWSGWRQLQERAAAACGSEAIPHFLSMEAWRGVFLPVETEAGMIQFPDDPTPLSVACLERLIDELEKIGTALDLPTSDDELQKLAARYLDNDDLIDDDMDIQTFAALLPSTRIAKERNQPLWVVK